MRWLWRGVAAVSGICMAGYMVTLQRGIDEVARSSKQREDALRSELLQLRAQHNGTQHMARRELRSAGYSAAARAVSAGEEAPGAEQLETERAPSLDDGGEQSSDEAADGPSAEDVAAEQLQARRALFNRVGMVTRHFAADPAWEQAIETGVEEVATAAGVEVEEFRCGKTLCSFSVKDEDRAVFGNPATGLVSKVSEHAKYVGFTPQEDGTVSVVIADQAQSLDGLDQ